MNEFNVSELKENTYFTDDVYLDTDFVLLSDSTPVTDNLLNMLTEWDFKKVYSNGAIRSPVEDGSDKDEKKSAQDSIEAQIAEVIKQANCANNENATEADRIAAAQSVFDIYLKYIVSVYTTYAACRSFNIAELSNEVRNLCLFIEDNKSYMLFLTPTAEHLTKNYLANHSLRSTITAISIGMQMRFPQPKLIELGVSCVLHEIGMIRLPPQLYMTDKTLSPADRRQIASHPLLGYQILNDTGFSTVIQLGALQHHEKENGHGYPQRLVGSKISLYAKIIAVACAFEAMTASRHYKKPKLPYEAMIEILKNESNRYDPVVIKALLCTYSLFPIGSYVLLQNNKIAQVADINPTNPKNPIVKILGDCDENGELRKFQTNDTDLKILKALSKTEIANVLKSK